MNRAVVGLLVGGALLLFFGGLSNGLSWLPPPDPEVDPFAAAGDRGWRWLGPILWRVGAVMVAVALTGWLIDAVL